MTIERAKRLAEQWPSGGVCTLRDGEAQEYHRLFLSMLLWKQYDVSPVRHGRWEKQSGLYSCSECGNTCPYDVKADVIEYWPCNYCPNCGAKMDGEM